MIIKPKENNKIKNRVIITLIIILLIIWCKIYNSSFVRNLLNHNSKQIWFFSRKQKIFQLKFNCSRKKRKETLILKLKSIFLILDKEKLRYPIRNNNILIIPCSQALLEINFYKVKEAIFILNPLVKKNPLVRDIKRPSLYSMCYIIY